ncbi:DUF2178 domain-containing protein [Clostridium hydrogenum]|uniref:DUF2178 domain-containing protein n=1 Tax=Clostridium hydrogenum TaxID=2855764 RepID=UPI001F1C3BCE|nr:DUF2178 domain-containing protein [Clostridium hydrogenum]
MSKKASSINAEKAKPSKSIGAKDERILKIREKSGYMTLKLTNYILYIAVIILFFTRASMAALFICVSLVIVQFLSSILFASYYSKRI